MTSGCGLGSLELFPCTSHSRNGTLLEMQILCESEVLSVGPKPASGLDLRTTGPGKQREGHVRLHHFPGVSRNCQCGERALQTWTQVAENGPLTGAMHQGGVQGDWLWDAGETVSGINFCGKLAG